ncbi:hypothetical protein CASFOL_012573 [Castilleja foliolosa]|uniref:Uncharacterized protein n=1 Tax=Castilleja foliolosa TaxID=1961234 RepID=A0ABD3CNX4_9LAMI
MATSRSGAGGKIVTNHRKQRLSATPYDRPPPPPSPSLPPPPKSPNWFRFLASGAGKVLNYIFAESESSSSEDDESASEDDIDNENLHEMPFNEVASLNEENVQNSETKWTIEQLILQARKREESDKLKIVLDSRVSEAGKKNLLAGSPGKTIDNEDADMYIKAVQEAKRWFQEKKAGESSVAELAHGTSNLNSIGLGHVETEEGSPVDVARTYMKERPPWSSPTKSFELRTPSTTTLKLFKERTLDSVSSKKNRTLLYLGRGIFRKNYGQMGVEKVRIFRSGVWTESFTKTEVPRLLIGLYGQIFRRVYEDG